MRSPRQSSIAPITSRNRSAATLGTNTNCSSPAASSRARRSASRLSVLTRSPDARGTFPPPPHARRSRDPSRRAPARSRSARPHRPPGPAPAASQGTRRPGPAASATARREAHPWTCRESRHASATRAHRARRATYSAAWSAPPRAGVSATGPCRPVPAHLCARCRPIYTSGRTGPTSIGSEMDAEFK